MPGMQSRQRQRQIISMHLLIRRLLVPDLPAVRRRRRRRDEEEFVQVGCAQVLVRWRDVGVCAEVDAHAAGEDYFAVQRLADESGGVDVVEDDDDAAEGF